MTSVKKGSGTQAKGKKSALSQKTAKILKKLLIRIGKSEQEIEMQRQFLANNDNMEPYSVFQRIDRNEDSFITSMEILNYLRDNGIHNMTEADCYYLVKFFDSDEDGRLNYPDFLQMILPCDHPQLRAKATQRPNAYISPYDFLTLDVERDLTKLLTSEIDLHRKSEKLKQQLESCLDYTEEGVYTAIDDWGYGFVDTRNVKGFFRNNKCKATDEDCIAIIRRLDLDADSKLTKEEFLQGVKAQEPYSKMLVRDTMQKKEELIRIKKQNKIDLAKGKRVNKKAEEGGEEDPIKVSALDKSYKEVLNQSPLKYRPHLDLYGTPMDKKTSPDNKANKSRNEASASKTPAKSASKARQQTSPQNQSMVQYAETKQKQSTFYRSGGDEFTTMSSPSKLKQSSTNYKTPQRNASNKKGPLDSAFEFSTNQQQNDSVLQGSLQQNTYYLENCIVNVFKEQLELEKRLERSKIDLSLRTDFNLIDVFRIFDTEGKGWITHDEIKDGLQCYGLFVAIEDIDLYLKRYDKDEDGKLRYSEFCDSFLPIDQFHASLLAKKAPMHLNQLNIPREMILYQETKELFSLCWKIHFTNESEAEKIRLTLSCNNSFNAYQCFQAIDNKGDGVVDKEEIKDLLIKFNMYISEKEICSLIDRYDRKRDGKITYNEFMEELTPRTIFSTHLQ